MVTPLMSRHTYKQMQKPNRLQISNSVEMKAQPTVHFTPSSAPTPNSLH